MTTGSVLAGTPAAAPAAAPAASPAAAPAPAPQWFEAPDNQEVTGWAKSRGYKVEEMHASSLAALQGHYNAEKLIGLDRAGRTVVMPKEDATPEEMDAFQRKLGKPATVNEYKVPDALKEDPVAKAFLDVAHKAGYSQKHLDPVFEFIGQQQEALAQQHEQAVELKAAADLQALKKEWGGEFELRSEAARRAVRELGLSPEEASSLENTLGLKRSAELFFTIGRGLLEDKPEGMGGHSGGGAKFGLTASEARAQIETLKRDADFGAKLGKGDADAKRRWDQLHQVAFGG